MTRMQKEDLWGMLFTGILIALIAFFVYGMYDSYQTKLRKDDAQCKTYGSDFEVRDNDSPRNCVNPKTGEKKYL